MLVLTTTPAAQVLPTDELAEPKKSHRQSHRKKVLPEIYLTRLLSTKVGLASHPHLRRLLYTCTCEVEMGFQGKRLRA